MGKKILMLTTIYPAPDLNLLNNTNVCHYFAKEWVKMGYEVKVIFNYPIYFPIFHWIAKFAEKKLASKGSAYVSTKRITVDSEYEMDGVKIFRTPIYKFMPRIAVSPKNINKQIEKIIHNNDKDGFKPDVVVAHFFYPHIEMVYRLKEHYRAKSCIVVHAQGMNLKKFYGTKLPILLDSIDTWGYRSVPLEKEFCEIYKPKGRSFYCYSGIPEEYLPDISFEKYFGDKINKYIYVGSFIKRKHPYEVLKALETIKDEWYLDYVGKGDQQDIIEQEINKNNLQNKVVLHGHMARIEVLKLLDKAHVFIMISSMETFGLVYIEAMSRGLITIASRSEGMDGIIKHGENGFLCEAGNVSELSSIIKKIKSLPMSEIFRISNNAIDTARNLTDKKVAKTYLDSIE